MNGRDEGRWESKPPDGIVSASPNKMEDGSPGPFSFATSDKMCAPRVREAQNRAREKREEVEERGGESHQSKRDEEEMTPNRDSE